MHLGKTVVQHFQSYAHLYQCFATRKFKIGQQTSHRHHSHCASSSNKLVIALVAVFASSMLCRIASRALENSWGPEDDAVNLITSKGYPVEVHHVTTSDGYILELHRIPHGVEGSVDKMKFRQVVFLQHGLLCSSADWLVNLRNESLAYLLADAGYDVWMGNIRGNTYSRKHVTLSPDTQQFWNFSLDEHALLDLPAMLNYTLQVTNQTQLYYIGHSQGTAIAFYSFLADKTLASKIKRIYALAPVLSISHIRGVIFYMIKHRDLVLAYFDVTCHGQLLLGNSIFNKLAKIACGNFFRELCSRIMFLVSGPSINNYDISRLPVHLRHTPAGSSVKILDHWRQWHKRELCKFDHENLSLNTIQYGQAYPPCFNLSELPVPVAAYSGGNDWIATPEDTAVLLTYLKHLLYHKHLPSYSHLDFVWGKDVRRQVYDSLLSDMADATQSYS